MTAQMDLDVIGSMKKQAAPMSGKEAYERCAKRGHVWQGSSKDSGSVHSLCRVLYKAVNGEDLPYNKFNTWFAMDSVPATLVSVVLSIESGEYAHLAKKSVKIRLGAFGPTKGRKKAKIVKEATQAASISQERPTAQRGDSNEAARVVLKLAVAKLKQVGDQALADQLHESISALI